MASFENVEINQGRSFTRPLLFHGCNFAHWKNLCKFLSRTLTTSYERLPPKEILCQSWREETKLFQSLYPKGKIEKVAKNYKALNILICGLNSNEFKCVYACDTAKEVLDILKTTYERISQVRESKINLYVPSIWTFQNVKWRIYQRHEHGLH